MEQDLLLLTYPSHFIYLTIVCSNFQLVYIAIIYLKCLKGPPTTRSHYSKSHHGLMMSSSQKKYIVKAIFINATPILFWIN